MASYEVIVRGEVVERIDNADAYQLEGPLTTFFRSPPGRRVVDSWSVRVASFRTTEIMAIRRLDDGDEIPALRSA